MFGAEEYSDLLYGAALTKQVSKRVLSNYRIKLGLERNCVIDYKIILSASFECNYTLSGMVKQDIAISYNHTGVTKRVKCEYGMGGKVISNNSIVYAIAYHKFSNDYTCSWRIDESNGMIVTANKVSISRTDRSFQL